MMKNKFYALFLLPLFIGIVFYGFITTLGPNDQSTVSGYLNNGGLIYSGNNVVQHQILRDNIEYTANWSAGTNMPAPTRYHGSGAMWTNSTKDTSKLICIGGDIDGSGNTSALVNVYNVTTNTWSAAPNVSAGRFYPSACCAGDSVYFFGGIGGTGGAFTSEVNTVDVYNVRTNTMTLGPVLPTTYGDQRTVPYQDSIIYVVGGLTGGTANATPNVYLFNRQSATYRAATPLPVARSSFACVTVGDTIYVVCGGTGYSVGLANTLYMGQISQSNRATITWTTGTSYPGSSLQRFYAEKWGCKGFITGCGSIAGFTTSTECYVYNTTTHAWTAQTSAPTLTSAYFSGSTPSRVNGITKWIVASGLVLIAPYSIPNVQIFTDSLCSGPTAAPLCEGFTGATFPPTGWTITGAGSSYWSRNAVSGFGLGAGSAAYDMYSAPSGTVGNLITLAFSPSVAGDSLKFDMAYCSWTSFPDDSLLILTSTNGGTTYSTLVAWGETQMNTASASCSHPFIPVASDWGRKGITLPLGTNMINFSGHSGFGDDVYVDSICVGHIITGVSHNQNGIPKVFALMQNYPNPFNPTTMINYALPKSSNVEIKVFDLVGREVTTLVNGFKQAGNYSVEFNANSFASGVYFYRIKAGDFTDTKKMLLVK